MRRIFGWGRRLGAAMSDNRGGPWGGRRRRWRRLGRRRRRPAQSLGPAPQEARPARRTARRNPFDEFLQQEPRPARRRLPAAAAGPTGSTALIAFVAIWLLWTTDPSDRPARARRRHHLRLLFAHASARASASPGHGRSAASQVIDVEEIRDLADSRRAGRESDPDRRPECREPRPIRCAGTSRTPNATSSRSPIPSRPSARSRKARCAPWSPGSASMTRSAPAAPRSTSGCRQACSSCSTITARACRSRASRSTSRCRPAAVNEAFLDVSAAQQQAQSAINQARGYALQQTARAQGTAAEFEQDLRRSIAPRPRSPAGACITRRWSAFFRRSIRPWSKRPESPPICRCPSCSARRQPQPQGQAPMTRIVRHPIAIGVIAILRADPDRQHLLDRARNQAGGDRPLRPAAADPQQISAERGFRADRRGLAARIPFVERIVWIDKRIQSVEMENQQVLSTDQ